MSITVDQINAVIAGCEGTQGGPWKLDKYACYVWAPSEKGGDFPLMDDLGRDGRVGQLRGWGYYTGLGHGALGLPPDDAEARQRRTGEHIARLDPGFVTELCTLAKQALAMQAALTPSGDTKAAYIGEFYVTVDHMNEEGEEESQRVTVPWTTTKEIMAAIHAYAEDLA